MHMLRGAACAVTPVVVAKCIGTNESGSSVASKWAPRVSRQQTTLRVKESEAEKSQKGRNPSGENGWKFIDVVSNRNVKLIERVIIPVRQHPKFNFIGKLLGPRGNSLKRLKEETGTKLSILGKGSMRDRDKEEDLRKSGEAKYAHLNEDLHVLIEVFAPPSQAYRRMGHALDEVKKYLVPDYNDEIRQQQLRELSFLKGEDDAEVGIGVHGRGGHARGHAPVPLPPIRPLPSLQHALASGRGLHSAVPQRMAAPRGLALARALAPPLPAGRGVPAPQRMRPVAAYRAAPPPLPPPPPPPPLAEEAYEEDYAYEDVYENGYEEDYGAGSTSQTNSAEEYCDYSYTLTLGEYDDFGQNGWSNTHGLLKAAPVWSMKGANREHPYGIY
uniref:KH domain-containing, RNA-binding, signal transduction-associated protein 2-like isoform X3 n=1 Tax=Petromyzon marinus TaxID=7757 RepID=A0AAJ7WVY0_PETMA|nr:KH domain-containing, RNA-binding, signal transduction-associated protein 2-like isoform X3 [Petromyzon marinus]XP_032810668.1 KH domain-containing, RNA-binding, signal transduction-associated protein 2-like isoform X3 [Petromyzon marinus]XP_032810669.1 KH domain-containing, RNA-binding, signal transduction-associated protein 2-like isoform X3 [Petromyzon marinus]XP_032810670.1 KH domain-containing, RNA-binding, signal transduction-associated protein 2-like isoform X3 [Petromyzon marinus]